MTIRARYSGITEWFEANMPDAASELVFSSPFQLLVAVILSAQCTDKRVNMVTPGLFSRYPDAEHLAEADPDELLELIKSVSYPNSKRNHLIGMALGLVRDFNGEVPRDTDKLRTLPGVGRKTANVVASICFDAPVIAVDTHVFRVAGRIGLSRGANVTAVEKDLTKNFPASVRARAHHWLILHGRYVCTARKPDCKGCGLKEWCASYSRETKKNKQ